jgi:hypothetical protein
MSPGDIVLKLFFIVTEDSIKQATAFVPGKFFQTGLMQGANHKQKCLSQPCPQILGQAGKASQGQTF